MRKILFPILSVFALFSCQNPDPNSGNDPIERQHFEEVHEIEKLVLLDTIFIHEKDTTHYKLETQHRIPYFVMEEVDTEIASTAHYYEDVELIYIRNLDTLYINKDSFLVHVNQEYMNEALIEKPLVLEFVPEDDYLRLFCSVRKPRETFQFHFVITVEENELNVDIADE